MGEAPAGVAVGESSRPGPESRGVPSPTAAYDGYGVPAFLLDGQVVAPAFSFVPQSLAGIEGPAPGPGAVEGPRGAGRIAPRAAPNISGRRRPGRMKRRRSRGRVRVVLCADFHRTTRTRAFLPRPHEPKVAPEALPSTKDSPAPPRFTNSLDRSHSVSLGEARCPRPRGPNGPLPEGTSGSPKSDHVSSSTRPLCAPG